MKTMILCCAMLSLGADTRTVRLQVTGLFAPEREQDLRETMQKLPDIKLASIDFKSAEAVFECPAKIVAAKPEQIVQQFDNMLRQASNSTFGVKPLRTIPQEKLKLIEIRVVGLDCKGCCLGAYEAIYKLEGVEQATASFREGRVTALIDPGKTDRAALEEALKKKGVQVLALAQAAPFKTIDIPDTVSPEARKYLESLTDPAALPEWPLPNDLAGWKREWEAAEAASAAKVQATLKRFEPTVVERKIGGVPVLDVRPKNWKDNGQVLVHAHGGAYTFYSARSRLPSSVPAADATGLRVISIDYSVAPAAKWPRAIDEVVAVLVGLQKEGHALKSIAIYGESAGGALAAGAVLKMRDQGLGMPAAVVLWSPWSDITNRGDSSITLKSFEPTYVYDKHLKRAADAYADPKDQRNPYVSPVYGDYSKGFPPTLIQGGTKEIFLSHFVRHYRAIDEAGGVAVLDLYEGMPHVFQIRPEMMDAPEARTALKKMAAFVGRQLAK